MESEKAKLVKKPRGIKGRKVLKKMNYEDSNLAIWGLTFLDVKKDSKILDLGCGNGLLIKYFLTKTDSEVYGADYSRLCCKFAIKNNKEEVKNGRCKIFVKEAKDLKLNPDYFDYCTAFRTLGFWTNYEQQFSNIYRMLKVGGKFVNCDHGRYDVDEVISALKKVGFKDIKINRTEENYICIISEK